MENSISDNKPSIETRLYNFFGGLIPLAIIIGIIISVICFAKDLVFGGPLDDLWGENEFISSKFVKTQAYLDIKANKISKIDFSSIIPSHLIVVNDKGEEHRINWDSNMSGCVKPKDFSPSRFKIVMNKKHVFFGSSPNEIQTQESFFAPINYQICIAIKSEEFYRQSALAAAQSWK